MKHDFDPYTLYCTRCGSPAMHEGPCIEDASNVVAITHIARARRLKALVACLVRTTDRKELSDLLDDYLGHLR